MFDEGLQASGEMGMGEGEWGMGQSNLAFNSN